MFLYDCEVSVPGWWTSHKISKWNKWAFEHCLYQGDESLISITCLKIVRKIIFLWIWKKVALHLNNYRRRPYFFLIKLLQPQWHSINVPSAAMTPETFFLLNYKHENSNVYDQALDSDIKSLKTQTGPLSWNIVANRSEQSWRQTPQVPMNVIRACRMHQMPRVLLQAELLQVCSTRGSCTTPTGCFLGKDHMVL